jgi:hypothetical protein
MTRDRSGPFDGSGARFRCQSAPVSAREEHLAGGSCHQAAVNRTYLSKLEKGASYSGLEIVAKLTPVSEVEVLALMASCRRNRKAGYRCLLYNAREQGSCFGHFLHE